MIPASMLLFSCGCDAPFITITTLSKMNREIKFRIWDKEESKFFEPIYEAYNGNLLDLSISMSGQLLRRTLELECEHESRFPDRYVLMQYTGLEDNHGKEIYEGDIVIVENSEPEGSGESDVKTICKWDSGCYVLEDNAGGHWTRQLFHQPHRLTIIGNIYENPELI